jgi:hypothetical protein
VIEPHDDGSDTTNAGKRSIRSAQFCAAKILRPDSTGSIVVAVFRYVRSWGCDLDRPPESGRVQRSAWLRDEMRPSR